jgi:hypothetical protein
MTSRTLHALVTASFLCGTPGTAAAQPPQAKASPGPDDPPLVITFLQGRPIARLGSDSIRTDIPFIWRMQKGARLRYSFKPPGDSARVTVTLDGRAVPASGEIVMDRQRDLEVTTTRIPRITVENRRLYGLFREMIAARSPDSAFQKIVDEVGCLMDWYGSPRAGRLVDDAERRAYEDVKDPEAKRRVQNSVTQLVESRSCARPRPRIP